MYKNIFSLFFGCLFVTVMQAQELYMPRNVKKAYLHGTRAMTGAPGKNYWQNKGVYDMQVTVTPENGMVKGFETISYSNNSPDTLYELALRFVNNMHKPNVARSSTVPMQFITRGLQITSLKINGEPYKVNSDNWGTVEKIKLTAALMPRSKMNVEIAWNYPLSELSGREGRIDSTTFFVAYSYPRISVYDDCDGWDMLEHNGAQEFYNDFNDYKVAVKVPANYVVWATGDFLNPDEVLQPAIAARLKDSYVSDSVVHIATREEMIGGKVTRQNEWNTWKFSYNHITDFTFAISNHYVWDGGSTIVDKNTKRRASMQAAYAATAADFTNSVAWGKHTLHYYSNVMPAVPYPYPKMTAFHGYGDMEFPMMVNDESVPNNLLSARMLQDHEMSHTYFPFYMGINEARYAFMDEGWAVYFTYRLSCELFGKQVGDSILANSRIKRWNADASAEMDMPLITMSSQLAGKAYRANSYNKAVAAYAALHSLLGEEKFRQALHHYMKLWHGKHPIPWDFFNSFNTATAQNLNWFWNNWFFSSHYMDLKIDEVKTGKKDCVVKVSNPGGLYIPAKVIAYYSDGTTAVKEIHVADWGFNKLTYKQISFVQKPNVAISKITIDNGVFADANPENNVWMK